MSDAAIQQEATHDDVARNAEFNRCAILGGREGYAVRLWWQRLTLSDGEARQRGVKAPPWPRGVRAILRRSETADAAVLTEGFRYLWQMAKGDDEKAAQRFRHRDIHAWACAALVAAELQDETPGATPGHAFGSQRKETEKPWVSELRFQQLQQSQTADELVRRMRRAIALVGHQNMSVVNLVDDVLLWSREHVEQGGVFARRPQDRIAFRWANDYYTTLAGYQRE